VFPPLFSAFALGGRDHGRDVRQDRRLLAGLRRVDAPVLTRSPVLRRPCDRRRRSDEYIWFDETKAVHALPDGEAVRVEQPHLLTP
jgi:hypothetical protein